MPLINIDRYFACQLRAPDPSESTVQAAGLPICNLINFNRETSSPRAATILWHALTRAMHDPTPHTRWIIAGAAQGAIKETCPHPVYSICSRVGSPRDVTFFYSASFDPTPLSYLMA